MTRAGNTVRNTYTLEAGINRLREKRILQCSYDDFRTLCFSLISFGCSKVPSSPPRRTFPAHGNRSTNILATVVLARARATIVLFASAISSFTSRGTRRYRRRRGLTRRHTGFRCARRARHRRKRSRIDGSRATVRVRRYTFHVRFTPDVQRFTYVYKTCTRNHTRIQTHAYTYTETDTRPENCNLSSVLIEC